MVYSGNQSANTLMLSTSASATPVLPRVQVNALAFVIPVTIHMDVP